jgi:hypothetical protein
MFNFTVTKASGFYNGTSVLFLGNIEYTIDWYDDGIYSHVFSGNSFEGITVSTFEKTSL